MSARNPKTRPVKAPRLVSLFTCMLAAAGIGRAQTFNVDINRSNSPNYAGRGVGPDTATVWNSLVPPSTATSTWISHSSICAHQTAGVRPSLRVRVGVIVGRENAHACSGRRGTGSRCIVWWSTARWPMGRCRSGVMVLYESRWMRRRAPVVALAGQRPRGARRGTRLPRSFGTVAATAGAGWRGGCIAGVCAGDRRMRYVCSGLLELLL